LTQIHQGALLHDIGKLKVPDDILSKPGSLTASEWEVMRCHPKYGFDFLASIEFLLPAAELVYSHHEKVDGSGYPRGLKGGAIPIGARIFAIVDSVDAMIYKRPYNIPISFDQAAAEVLRCAGKQFDAELIQPALTYLAEEVAGDSAAMRAGGHS
jgi:HD-GYP domain-containing protein (c-di-GMP phosphodiesterase class II)